MAAGTLRVLPHRVVARSKLCPHDPIGRGQLEAGAWSLLEPSLLADFNLNLFTVINYNHNDFSEFRESF